MTQSKPPKAVGLKSLADHITENHGGNNSAFGRSLPESVERHQVAQWLNAKKPVYVFESKLVQVIRELE